MFLNFINIIKDMIFFTGSYSNQVFLEPLSKDEEDYYIDQMFNHNVEARNKLIEHNLRLVAHIVKKFDNGNMMDDLISIGTIGLIKGIDTYSKDKTTKITTYAAKCIENEILMYFRSNKKHSNNVSLNDSIGYDKDGNEIGLIDVICDNKIDIIDQIHNNINIELLFDYFNILND